MHFSIILLVLILVLGMKLIQFFIFVLAQAMTEDEELAQAVRGKNLDQSCKFRKKYLSCGKILLSWGKFLQSWEPFRKS